MMGPTRSQATCPTPKTYTKAELLKKIRDLASKSRNFIFLNVQERQNPDQNTFLI